MKNKIQILPPYIFNKIAAGEVVNRPESVVKELIENSIDSGADNIQLVIKDSGKTLIQVIDNGCGMNEEDAETAFKRHATSKINSIDDLESIKSLGFRGEALAAISSISHIEIKTKTAEDTLGTYLKIEGNDLKDKYKIAAETGTSIAVKNLFYNTPARRNFLKSDTTEFKHIYETFTRLAISHPEISFSFINNDTNILKLEKTDKHIVRITEIFGKDYDKNLIPFTEGNNLLSINGFISKPSFVKKSRSDQFMYLNKRFFNNKNLNFAIYSAYDDLIEKGNYPAFIVFIEIDPSKVDVNIHPSKLEIRFEDESAIFGFLKSAIKKALKSSQLIFDLGFIKGEGSDQEELYHKKPRDTNYSFSKSNYNENKSSIHNIFHNKNYNNQTQSDIFSTDIKTEKDSPQNQDAKSEEIFNVWQFANKYIICELDNGIMIIDQHAAHERILYESVLERLESNGHFTQQLLIPISLTLTKIDIVLTKQIEKELKNLGFDFSITKEDTIVIKGIPTDVKPGDENTIFRELIDQYREYEIKLNLDKRDNLAKSFACRSAVKTGQNLKKEEMINLIDELFGTKMPYVCPHGRPTIIRITTEELDKRFNRN